MNTPSPDKSAKPPKSGKDSRKAREFTAELAALRADIDSLKAAIASQVSHREPAPAAAPPTAEASPQEQAALEAEMRERLGNPPDAALLYAFALSVERPEGAATVSGSHQTNRLDIQSGGLDERAARIGYALASLPKVALLRLLLTEGPQSAASLGEKAGLSTGSLYHHLRELVHSGVIHQAGRNQYALTTLGHHTTVLLFALAGSDLPSS